jgi:hypothetical protein
MRMSAARPILATVNSFQSQWRLALSNGLVVERLPVGFAAGRWWATFVYAVPGWEGLEPPVDWRTVSQCAWVHDPEDRLECVGGSGGGTEREYDQTWELVDHGASQAEVNYIDEGDNVGRELLTLDQTDRSGYFAIRLPDGSLIERLPVGHAHGMWRLLWVRSDVPRAETEAAMEDDEDLDMPHERFIRLRSAAGPIGRVDASGDIGGSIQPFGVEVSDAVTHLEVDYLFEGTPAGTEVLPLPAVQDP